MNKVSAQQRQLLIILALLGLSIIFWNSIVLYPVKLFVVFLHELSHGLTAVITGGSIEEIQISEGIGGLCITRGGWPFVVTSSGYLGSMLLGGIIFLSAMKRRRARVLGWSIAALLLIVTIGFIRNTFGIVFGLLFGIAIGVGSRFLPDRALETVLQYLGALSCLYALIDIKEDLITLEPRLTDAAILSDMTGLPAIVWGVIWGVLAIAAFYFIMRAAFKKASRSDAGVEQS